MLILQTVCSIYQRGGGTISLMYIRKNGTNELQHTVSNNSASIRKIITVQENDEISFGIFSGDSNCNLESNRELTHIEVMPL